MKITVTNAGPDTDTLHVLPTAWFRNTWSWDVGAVRPVMAAAGPDAARVEHPYLGTLELAAGSAPDGIEPTLLFCENETNTARLFGAGLVTAYPGSQFPPLGATPSAADNPGAPARSTATIRSIRGCAGTSRRRPHHRRPGQ